MKRESNLPGNVATVAIAAMAILGSLAALAQESKSDGLTVGEVVVITNAIAGLDLRRTGGTDASGLPATVPSGFKFPPKASVTLALNLARGRDVVRVYNDEVAKLRVVLAGPGNDVPKERMDDFAREVAKIEAAPSGIKMGRIAMKDLCLEAAPPDCPQRNDVPLQVLSALLPIVDQ